MMPSDDVRLPTPDASPIAAPAATLVIFRDCAGAAPELLMVERARTLAFAGGATVFPGGRLEPGDHLLAAALGMPSVGDDWQGAARVAAIRETIEETGVAVGVVPPPSARALTAMRAGLHAGEPFQALLAAAGATLDLAALTLWARWRPAHRTTRIFDTIFFIAALPADAPPASVDETENVRLAWASAQKILDTADEGRCTIIFPTRRNLERLAQFASHADALAHAAVTPVRVVTPWNEDRDGVPHACIPDDLGYPITAEPLATAMRG